MASEAVVRIDCLTKRFRTLRGSVYAVRDVTLAVERGTVVAFVGPNGAGKTTTIYAMLGLLRPTAGRVDVFGEPAGRTASRRRLGFVSEIFYTYPFWTAREAMRFYGRLGGMAADALDARLPAVLARLGLGEAIDRRIGTFSKGMRQRLGVAQALVHAPELLILDEPTTGLDPEGRKLVADLILAEKARGTTVFLSSHILADVERTSDHVVMIRRGEVVVSEAMARLREGGDEWEVAVAAGWTAELAADLRAAGYAVDPAGAAAVRCPGARKQELLRRLVAQSADIGTVRRAGRSLEDLYMEHVGGGHG
jgi:ABC-type multidrug transport system ATPase subunit